MPEETLTIPESEIVPLTAIADGIEGLRILFVNVFGVMNPGGTWTLIDAGLPFSATRIQHWAERTFGIPPSAIVLTHGHFDHVSAAKALSDTWHIPIYAHPLEMPFLNGSQSYPPPDPTVGGGVMALMSPLYPRGPVDLGDRLRTFSSAGSSLDATLDATANATGSGTLDEMPGWRWIHTPGHTVGHTSFFRESDRSLLVGDAFCTVKAESMMAIARMKPELHGPPAYYTPDWPTAKSSVQKLAALAPTTLIPGHGQPLSGADLPAQLDRLAARFDDLALPTKDKPHLR